MYKALHFKLKKWTLENPGWEYLLINLSRLEKVVTIESSISSDTSDVTSNSIRFKNRALHITYVKEKGRKGKNEYIVHGVLLIILHSCPSIAMLFCSIKRDTVFKSPPGKGAKPWHE